MSVSFDTLYNFGGQIGDSWTRSQGEILGGNDSVTFEILAHTQDTFQGNIFPGIILNRKYTSINGIDSALFDTVYQYLGGRQFLLEQFDDVGFLCDPAFMPLVCYTDSTYGSVQVSRNVLCDFTIATNNLTQLPNFSIFPNPVNNELHYQNLNLPQPAQTLLQLYDLQGNKISETRAGGESGIWELQQLPAGLYFLIIQTPTTRYFGSKLVKM